MIDPGSPSNQDPIRLTGVRQNNLKNLQLEIPTNSFVVITGPSGSGKSSLAFDTLFAEGQRRYVETFSPYARQFFDRMDKPAVDRVENIPPSIAIEQKNSVKTTRSTVATMTELADYMKHLWPHLAKLHCRGCNKVVVKDQPEGMWKKVVADLKDAQELIIVFELPLSTKMSLAEELELLVRQGYQRIWLNDQVIRVSESLDILGRNPPKAILVIQDRLKLATNNKARFIEACGQAFHFGKGKLRVFLRSGIENNPSADTTVFSFSDRLHCASCDLEYKEPTLGLFHFNHPSGACSKCRGFGRIITINYDLAIPDETRTLAEGVVKPWLTGHGLESQNDLMKFCKKRKVPTNIPFRSLSQEIRDWVIQGDPGYGSSPGVEWPAAWYGVKGYFRWLESKSYKMHYRVLLSKYRSYVTCTECHGNRFQPEALLYRWRIGGRDPVALTLAQFYKLPIQQACSLLQQDGDHNFGNPSSNEDPRAFLKQEVISRLGYLVEVGLGYLTLDRPTRTLSGGETERVNLTTCLGTSLVNTLFVLDEPSVGLHHRDTSRLIQILYRLQAAGNTVVVVEHDPEIIRAADHIIDIGPKSGELGGECMYAGPANKLHTVNLTSLTAQWLDRLDHVGRTNANRTPKPSTLDSNSKRLVLTGASCHNIRNIDVKIPLQQLVTVTGVSGSGKSTLIRQILVPMLQHKIKTTGESTFSNHDPAEHGSNGEALESIQIEIPKSDGEVSCIKSLEGWNHIRHVVMVDQSGVAKTPRSNPALYIGAFDFIRELFASSGEAKKQGLTATSFSFNSEQGRCDHCRGVGFEQIEMQFLSDVFIRCPECSGRRYRQHILDITIRPTLDPSEMQYTLGKAGQGTSVADVLEATVDNAIQWLSQFAPATGRKISPAHLAAAKLKLLSEVGLGYLRLGQPINTLSGGECQRIKLVRYLAESRPQTSIEPTLFVFDEPTTGLHMSDVNTLLHSFRRLVDLGHSVIVIEHNLEVIRASDWVIDLGPEGGDGGGRIVAQGPPEEITANQQSSTGAALRGAQLNGSKHTTQFRTHSPTNPQAYSSVISIKGAKEHNLKNVDVSIPRNQFVVVTGVSGSGKSTLAFDILFAEGQRRFLDSMSAYARQFVEQLPTPHVDQIKGLPPTVSIEQRVSRGGGKSTVATVTEIHHFLRLLYARLGMQFCPKCLCPASAQSRDGLVRALEEHCESRGRLLILAPVVRNRKGFHTEVTSWALKNGYKQIRVDGELVDSNSELKLERFKEHSIEIVVGLYGNKDESSSHQNASQNQRRALIDTALKIGEGTFMALDQKKRITLHSTHKACAECGTSYGEMDPKSFSYNSPQGWCKTCRGFGELFYFPDVDRGAKAEAVEESWFEWQEGKRELCNDCKGTRINEVARHVLIPLSSKRVHTPVPEPIVEGYLAIHELCRLSVVEARDFLPRIKMDTRSALIAQDILPEIKERLEFLVQVGLGYLNLDRSVPSLSGGESQRIRLAAQLGSNLSGVLYILDEPTIGLHPRDNDRLLDTLQQLRVRGNSLVVVEHDEQTMKRADQIIDLGPGAGVHGGRVVAQGSYEQLIRNPESVTGQHMRLKSEDPPKHTRRTVPTPEKRGASKRKPRKTDSNSDFKWLTLEGVSINNLANLTIRIPMRRFVVVTGVSGSGKSSLVRGALLPLLRSLVGNPSPKAKLLSTSACATGTELIDAVYEVDQTPIGRTPRSTPATYVGFFDEIRVLFSQTPMARIQGYGPGQFSFNSSLGRCPICEGSGNIKLEMNFLPPAYITCGACGGSRFNPETLEVYYNGKNIAQILEMSVEQALAFFSAFPKLMRPLSALVESGLGYLKLGQTSPTLSGGEAQRVKLVTHLLAGLRKGQDASASTKSHFFILEEPTIGLHLADVNRLIRMIQRLVDAGHTVLVIEHNLDLISACDWIIDLGPEAGPDGGKIVAQGSPESVISQQNSHTGRYLKEVLSNQQQASKENSEGPSTSLLKL